MKLLNLFVRIREKKFMEKHNNHGITDEEITKLEKESNEHLFKTAYNRL